MSHSAQARSRSLRWREVSLSSTNLQALGVGFGDLDFYFSPAAIGLLVGGDVADRVLPSDLLQNLIVNLLEILDAAREEGCPSGRFGHDREPRSLRKLLALRLVREQANRVDRDVRRLELLHHLVETQFAGGVATVGIDHHDLPAILLSGADEIEADGVVQRREPASPQASDTFGQTGKLL